MFDLLTTKILIDAHCHLNDTSFDLDRDKVVERAIAAGVEKIVDIVVDIDSSKKALKNSQLFPGVVFPTAGIDPEIFVPGSDLFDEKLFNLSQIGIGEWINKQMKEMEELLKTGKFVMVGECGMDYYWLERNEKISEEEKKKSKLMQKLLFSSQVELAIKYKIPLSIHSRGAEKECLDVLEQFVKEVFKGKVNEDFSGSLHSFTGTVEQAKRAVGLGFKIGVNGIVTYKKAENIREVVKAVGRGNIVFETDAPFLVPLGFQPMIGGRNEPAAVKDVKEYISGLFAV